MIHTTPTFTLTFLFLNIASIGAGSPMMRVSVESNGAIGDASASLADLQDMFADDFEAADVTSKLLILAQATPKDELLPFVQNLKADIMPWHDQSQEKIFEAIKEIKACAAGIVTDIKMSQEKMTACQDDRCFRERELGSVCQKHSVSHKAHRTVESTELTTLEALEAKLAAKLEAKETECNNFAHITEVAEKAKTKYEGGDVKAHLNKICEQFSGDLLPKYDAAEKACNLATAEDESITAITNKSKTTYTVQKETGDSIQTQLDVSCCQYALARKTTCEMADLCYKDKVESYNKFKAIIQGEEKIKKTEWRVYSRIECLLPILNTDKAPEIMTCRKLTYNTSKLDIEYPAAPPQDPCNQVETFPGNDVYYKEQIAPLPVNAKGKEVQQCAGMFEDQDDIKEVVADIKAPAPKASCANFAGKYTSNFHDQPKVYTIAQTDCRGTLTSSAMVDSAPVQMSGNDLTMTVGQHQYSTTLKDGKMKWTNGDVWTKQVKIKRKKVFHGKSSRRDLTWDDVSRQSA